MTHVRAGWIGAALFAVCAVPPGVSHAATITVATLADGPPAADGVCTLREAVIASNNDIDGNGCTAAGPYGFDSIELAQSGTIQLVGAGGEDLSLSGDLDIHDSVTITNVSGGTVIVDGGGNDRIFHVGGGVAEVVFDGLIIQNGAPPAFAPGQVWGGGIFMGSTSALFGLTLIDVIVRDNTVIGVGTADAAGGGIYSNSNVLLVRSEITGNSVENINDGVARGGGIYALGVQVTRDMTAIDSRISGNTVTSENMSASGGGVYLSGLGTASFMRSEISGNEALSTGSNALCGGICTLNAGVELINSTVSGNLAVATDTGGIAQAGGIQSADDFIANGSTIAFNQAVAPDGTTLAGGIRLTAGATSEIANTLIGGNLAGGAGSDCSPDGALVSLGHNLIETGCGVTAAPGDQFGVAPMLDVLADNGGLNTVTANPRTHSLLPGSPATDAGSPDPVGGSPACESVDQRGYIRPADGGTSATCDIGAHEVNAMPPAGLPGVLSFTAAEYVVDEDGGSVVLEVERTGGSDGQVSVAYATSDFGAQAPDDYIAASDTLIFGDGVTSAGITIDIVDDGVFEFDEIFTVALSNPQGGASIGDPGSALVTILDDDGPDSGMAVFSSDTYTVAETVGEVAITVCREGGSDGTLTVAYQSQDGSAMAGQDYESVSGSLSWPGGGAGCRSFDVPILDDLLAEPTEAFDLILGSAVNPVDVAEVFIIDGDEGAAAVPVPALGWHGGAALVLLVLLSGLMRGVRP